MTASIDILDPEGWDWPVNSTDDVIAALERRKEGGRGFRVASAALGSSAQFRELSVYDLDRAIVGEFDFVYVGSLLMHLRDPVRALERVGAVCRGRLLLVDNINLGLSLLAPRRPIRAVSEARIPAPAPRNSKRSGQEQQPGSACRPRDSSMSIDALLIMND